MTHDDAIEARKRRMEANYLISLEDPGRFAPQARQGLATFAANQGIDASKRLRDHELIMLQQQGINDVEKEDAHAFGLRGQGAEAARINARAQMEIAKMEHGWTDDKGEFHEGSRVRGIEEQSQSELYRTKLELEKAEREWGKTDDKGNWIPGGRQKLAEIEGANAARLQQESNKGLIAKAEADRITQAINNEAKIEQARIAAGGKISAAKLSAVGKVFGSAITGGAMSGKDPATVVAELREQYKNDPEALAALGIYEEQSGTKTGTAKWGAGKK